MTAGVLTQAADLVDPDTAVDRPELATPTTLAAHLDSAYQVRAHLTLIGEELAKLEAGVEFDRLMINTPPRVGKTRLAVEWFCFWWLIRHPTHRIIVASYDDSLAQRAGKHIRALIERYGARYGLVLEHGSTAAKDWSLSTGGGVRSVGIGSGITGHDGDVLIFDDPTKSRAEAESVKRRDAIYDWWSAEFSTRVVPGTRILGIQCIVASMRVLMADGRWVKIEDVRLGDRVVSMSPDARGLQVGTVTDQKLSGYDETVEIRTERLSLKTNRTHPFAVLRREGMVRPAADDVEWVQAGDLRPGNIVVTAKSLPNDAGPFVDEMPGGGIVSEEMAWLLGYFLGDGWVTKHKRKNQKGQPTSYAVCCAQTRSKKAVKADLNDRVYAALSAWSPNRVYDDGRGCWRTDWNDGGRLLVAMGYDAGARGKRVPACVWAWSPALRRAFIKGYVEADGSLTFAADRPSARSTNSDIWSAGSVNREMLVDIRDLALTCGVRPSKIYTDKPRTHQPPNSPHPVTSVLHILRLAFALDQPEGFGLIQGKAHPASQHIRYERVREVVPGPVLPVYDVTVEGTQTFVAEGFVTHNTPWHPDDLRVRIINQEGRVETGGRWREVIMAALTEDPADPLGRSPGEPLPHPKIAEGDTHRLQKWWERIRSSIAVRDWRALYQCDPKAPEGQLVSWDLLRERRCHERPDGCAPRGRAGVSVDPSGGGRDTAGIVAGHLDDDGRCVFTHDRSGVMSSADWGRAACDLAVEVGAEFICYETNYGGDQAEFVIKTAWNELRREQPDRFSVFVPRIIGVHSRKGKLLRAEPIAQQWKEDRCRTGDYLPDLESEWATWVVGGDSPGRIDASVHLAYELLPVPSTGDSSLAGVAMMMDTDLLAGGLWGR